MASLVMVGAMTLVIVSCSTSPTNPVSPSAVAPDATSASGIVKTTTSPTPAPSTTPTPTPSPTPDPGEGRFTGGGHVTVEPYGKITYGLTIHCDLILSNNLEINWAGKDANFHLDIHQTTVTCTEVDGNQPPPAAPLDTLTGTGVGWFNGDPDYTITFTFYDSGEPGVNDRIAFLIKSPGGATVLDISEEVDGGNLQAHFDQPHKK